MERQGLTTAEARSYRQWCIDKVLQLNTHSTMVDIVSEAAILYDYIVNAGSYQVSQVEFSEYGGGVPTLLSE